MKTMRFLIAFVFATILAPTLTAQCTYVLALGDTWATRGGGADVRVIIRDINGARLSRVDYTNSINGLDKEVEYYKFTIGCGESIKFNYRPPSGSNITFVNGDNFIRISDTLNNELMYRGDSTKYYYNIDPDDEVQGSDDSTFVCDCRLMSDEDLNKTYFDIRYVKSPFMGNRQVKVVSPKSDSVQIWRSAYGIEFTLLGTVMHNQTLSDTECLTSQFVYYSTITYKDGVGTQQPTKVIENHKCYERGIDVYLDGRNGGSKPLQLKGGRLIYQTQ